MNVSLILIDSPIMVFRCLGKDKALFLFLTGNTENATD